MEKSAFPILIRTLNGVDQIHDQAVIGHRHIVAAGLLHNGTVDGVNFRGNAAPGVLSDDKIYNSSRMKISS